jgi:hypothetical protein
MRYEHLKNTDVIRHEHLLDLKQKLAMANLPSIHAELFVVFQGMSKLLVITNYFFVY